MKYAWMEQHRSSYALIEMCGVLEVSISGYRSWMRGGTPDRKGLTDAQMLAIIRAIHAELKGAYGSPRMVRELGMICSMSRKGNCWDNAPTESWFNSFKKERYHGIRYATHDEMKAASFEYIEVFYNRTRQHSTLGYQSPIQFLECWRKKQDQEKLAA